MDSTDYGSTLGDFLNKGAEIYGAVLNSKTERSTANAAAAASSAQASQMSSIVKIAIVGAGVLLVALVGLFIFKRK